MKFRLQTWLLGAVLLMTLLAWESLIERHPHVAIAGGFGFYAWFGFAACLLLIVVALLVGRVLKRRDDYYEGRRRD